MNSYVTLIIYCILFFELRFGTAMKSIDEIPTIEVQVQHVFIPKSDQDKTPLYAKHCECYNSTDGADIEIECRCRGKAMIQIPTNLDTNLQRISLTEADVKFISRDSFQPYKDTLEDVVLGYLPLLKVIEGGSFRDIPNLRSVYISHTPQLKFLYGLFTGTTCIKFRSLRIIQTGLLEIPDLSSLSSDEIVHMIELDGNKIQKITTNSINIKAEQVTLNYNEITEVEAFAFNGSQIGKLSLKGNLKLKKMHIGAFKGLHSLRQLDLSATAIDHLPAAGLQELDVLKVEKTPSMKTIPSLYELQSLTEARLTHPFHCCAFKYPEQHDPVGFAHYQEKIKRFCEKTNHENGPSFKKLVVKRSADTDVWENTYRHSDYPDIGYVSHPTSHDEPNGWTPNLEHQKPHASQIDGTHLNPLRGKTIEYQEASEIPLDEDMGTFLQGSAEILENKRVDAFCGNLTAPTRAIKCYPAPNALNPCEDVMGSNWLRVCVWFVVILSAVGNFSVILVLLFSGGELSVQRFLISNLAFADFCMALYLLLIASMDVHSVGSYFNHAYDWQYGVGCQVAGFLTVFASQLSIFTLTLVTVERWFAITHAIHLTRRISLTSAFKIMFVGWIYSVLAAVLPVLGISNYSSTSICLPMEVNEAADQAYLIGIIVVNGGAFLVIVFCYIQIYLSLGRETRQCKANGEMTIAKKMALLVFTDFACWAPIAFFSLTALAGYPLIGVTRSKILLVFFYPLNSCANPYLYAIMTAQYRRDFFVLLSKCGLCTKTAQHYTLSSSFPTGNNSHPLLTKQNARRPSVKANNVADVYV